jgi:ATP-dependent helicase HrpB
VDRVPLPIDPYIPEIVARVRERRAVVVTAAPGAGKTTRVPPALVADGAVIVLQPRRVAARSIARRIAEEQGWTIGREVGWHVRFERQFGPETRLLLATEGILTARLQQDPLLSDFRTIVLDEFHERAIHADLGLALARQAWTARDDLRLVVMSATLDAGGVAAFLDGCPVIQVPGRSYPLGIAYMPGASVAEGVRDVIDRTDGQVLCFLPGAPEILRAANDVAGALRGRPIEIVPLHGGLDAAGQDRAVAPADRRRIIIATNIAETSLTVAGITAVVDTGLHKVARYDPDRAIDSLETERISRDSADQRAGRAGRVAAGIVRRLWHETDRLRPHREPDIMRIDLSGPLLDVIAWGGDPRALEWFEAPPPDAVDAAIALLERLGAIDGGRLTALGRRMHRFPLHPRLARILVAAAGAREAALACALLSERHYFASPGEATSSDLLSAIARERELPPHTQRVARELQALAGAPDAPALNEPSFRKALLAGYPDRVARRRAPGSPRVLLASGHGAVLSKESGVYEGEYLVALDVRAARRGEIAEAGIRLASAIDRDWLAPTDSRTEHLIGPDGIVRSVERDYYGEIVLAERVVRARGTATQKGDSHPNGWLSPSRGEERIASLLAAEYLSRGLSPGDEQLLRRIRFAGIEIDAKSLIQQAAQGCRSLAEIDLARHLPWRIVQQIDREAPERLAVPSGRSHRLDYRDDGSVVASVKLQELFGLADTPVLGPRREPVLLALLAPNGRPVQLTTDLRSFWERTYPEVRKELRGRYPRHPWPEDPWSAPPTARTKGVR